MQPLSRAMIVYTFVLGSAFFFADWFSAPIAAQRAIFTVGFIGLLILWRIQLQQADQTSHSK